MAPMYEQFVHSNIILQPDVGHSWKENRKHQYEKWRQQKFDPTTSAMLWSSLWSCSLKILGVKHQLTYLLIRSKYSAFQLSKRTGTS